MAVSKRNPQTPQEQLQVALTRESTTVAQLDALIHPTAEGAKNADINKSQSPFITNLSLAVTYCSPEVVTYLLNLKELTSGTLTGGVIASYNRDLSPGLQNALQNSNFTLPLVLHSAIKRGDPTIFNAVKDSVYKNVTEAWKSKPKDPRNTIPKGEILNEFAKNNQIKQQASHQQPQINLGSYDPTRSQLVAQKNKAAIDAKTTIPTPPQNPIKFIKKVEPTSPPPALPRRKM